MTLPSGRRSRPEPWIWRKNRSTGSAAQPISSPPPRRRPPPRSLPAHPPPAALAGGRVRIEQVGRLGVNRPLTARLAGSAAGDLGLVIAGREGGAVADLDRLEAGPEEAGEI